MSINTIIEEQKKSLPKMIVDLVWSVTDGGCKLIESGIQSYQEEPIREYEDILDWHTQSIKQILEAEVERLKGMKKEVSFGFKDGNPQLDAPFFKLEIGYNQSLDDQITHLINIIKELC